MNHKKTAIIFILVAVFVLFVVVFSNFTYKSNLVIGGKTYVVEVAETEYLLQKGLSGHKPLKSDEGMFFIFKSPSKYGFWMKKMLFPIDIVWIGQDFRITHIEKYVKPETFPTIFYPESDSMYVFEFNSGQSDLLNLKIGDPVEFVGKPSKNL